MKQKALCPQEICAGLTTHILGQTVRCLPVTVSTNEDVKALARTGAEDGLIVTAEQQTGGKGRLGRQWNSPADGGLYFTLLLREVHLPKQLAGVTLLAGLAVCTALRKLFCTDARIKWPNDVVIGGKKVCGILCEAGTDPVQGRWAAVGIGVNVNQPAFPPELAVRATSLLLETGKVQNRCVILQNILEQLEPILERCKDTLPEDYTRLCVSLGRQVSFTRGHDTLCGTARAVTPSGELLVELPDGSQCAVTSGEVTVQGIYGN